MNITPKRRRLGQHFLINPYTIKRIISVCDLQEDDQILEIGPGLGVLTARLAAQVKNVIAVEKDQRLCEELQKRLQDPKIQIVNADFLKFPIGSLESQVKVVGNIPYYISSPIIEKLIENRRSLTTVYIMVQLEFGQRMIAKVNTKEYSALSCWIQYYADIQLLFRIKNTCFKPMPKVHSCFLRLTFYEKPLFNGKDETQLFTIIQKAFQQRRKTILNSLSSIIEKEKLSPILESLKINPKLRAENLTIEDFGGIMQKIGSREVRGKK